MNMILQTIGTSALVSLLVIFTFFPKQNETTYSPKETVYERVMRTRELRCGYYVFPPVTYRDPNTGELSGFTIEMMNEIGKRSGIKVTWAEEYSWAGWTQGLERNRFDVACTPNWPEIAAGSVVAYGIPMFYAGIYPVVRADDTRFTDHGFDQFNKPDITFAALDGDPVTAIAQVRFPKAKLNVLPPSTDNGTYALQVVVRKADVMLWDQNGIFQFNKENKEKLRIIAGDTPVKLQAFSLAVERKDMILKDWLDNAVLELINDGTIDRLLRKWEAEPGKTFLRVASPFKIESEQ